MKLLEKNDKEVVFWLHPDEHKALLLVLNQYPVLKENYQSLTKSQDPKLAEAAQELLRQSLAEQKAENLRFKQNFMVEGRHLKKSGRGWKMILQAHEIERLLQVLNDVRVGLWYQLDCPENTKPTSWLGEDAEKLEKYWMMEISGALEWNLIELMENFGY